MFYNAQFYKFKPVRLIIVWFSFLCLKRTDYKSAQGGYNQRAGPESSLFR